jgi:CRISPR-associated endonuclease Csn1
VVDPVTKQILLNHLQQEKFLNQIDENGKSLKPEEVAFSQTGIADMNDNILELNNGTFHHPIRKVRLKFSKGNQFSIRRWTDEKDHLIRETKFVKSATGTNLYFCIYEKDGERKYYVPRFEEIIETQKLEKDLPITEKKNVPEHHPDFPDFELKFYLQPNDLVYIPSNKEDIDDLKNPSLKQLGKFYKYVSGSGTTADFVPLYSADTIYGFGKSKAGEKKHKEFSTNYSLEGDIKNEFGMGSAQSKNQNSIDGIQIKSVCWKLKTNRLGQIIKIEK